MKKINYLLGLATAVLFASTFVACQSDDTLDNDNRSEILIKLAKNPDFVLYSGETTLGSTFATKADVGAFTRANVESVGAFSYHKIWDGDFPVSYKSSTPAELTQEEKNFVIAYIKQNPNEGGVEFYNIDYFIQNVGSSKDNYSGDSMKDQNGASHNVTGGNHMDYLVINGQHINDYNATYGPTALVLNLPVQAPTYHDSWGDLENTKADSWKMYKITFNGKEGYYLCFDYKTKKNSKEHHDGDGVYNDWVVKLTPANDRTFGAPEAPENPEEEENQETPGENNQETPGENNQGGENSNVVTPIKGEVEVNLSVNDEKAEGDYISTKLSIHVRSITDVTVTIPVTAEYYCDADDMAIVVSHQASVFKYNDTDNHYTMNYDVNGTNVTLTVTYKEDCIEVSTSGMTAELQEYLNTTYGDGLTFEVWNYYNENATRPSLKQMLDQSTVAFADGKMPGHYVNAFAMLYDYQKEGKAVYIDPATNVPYECEMELDADGMSTGQIKVGEDGKPVTVGELAQKYWTRNDQGVIEFVGAKNAWDCKVAPTQTGWEADVTNNGTAVKNFNAFYKFIAE